MGLATVYARIKNRKSFDRIPLREDRETESAKMGNIYAAAQLTIIAASAESCHSRFLNTIRFTTLYSSVIGFRIVARYHDE